jgi:hypothetical protein
MTTKYGYEAGSWNAAKEEMRQALTERARTRGMIPYSELVSRVTAIMLEPDSFALAAMLGEISSEEDEAGRGMLTVIVVHKDGDMQPGPGFFELAKKLGRDTSDILRCWVDELHVVHRVWSGT